MCLEPRDFVFCHKHVFRVYNSSIDLNMLAPMNITFKETHLPRFKPFQAYTIYFNVGLRKFFKVP